MFSLYVTCIKAKRGKAWMSPFCQKLLYTVRNLIKQTEWMCKVFERVAINLFVKR